MINIKKGYILTGCLALMAFNFTAAGQEANDSIPASDPQEDVLSNAIYIDPLFDYPVAPEDLPDLQSRTDYLMEHFWDNFDFKKKDAVDQIALNHAFTVYTEAMSWASRKKAEESVKNLVNKLKKNPVLLFQFTKAAEENLFGPRAIIWADEMYMYFLDTFLGNKQISDNKKKRFHEQRDMLNRNKTGEKIASFKYVSKDGSELQFHPLRDFTLIEFAGTKCDDCRYANTKMDISSVVNDLIEEGRLNVLIVQPGETANPDLSEIKQISDKWLAGISKDAFEVMDIRINPAFYLVDKDGKILIKNNGIDEVIAFLEQSAKN